MKRFISILTTIVLIIMTTVPSFGDGSLDYNQGEPFVVTCEEDSTIDLKPYLGAYVTAYMNADGEITAIKEAKSVFIEDDIRDLQEDYVFSETFQIEGYKSFLNGDVDPSTPSYMDVDGSVKLAVRLNGLKVMEVYSMQRWDAAETFRADGFVQDEIRDSHKINGYQFALDDYDRIDSNTFSLIGKESLSDITKDDIVTVYLHRGGALADKVAKLEVSSSRIEGKVTRINTANTKFTINGTAYRLNEFSYITAADLSALMFDETEAVFYLDYAGQIFSFDAQEDAPGYAVVLATGSGTDKYGNLTYYAKLLLADGTNKEFSVKESVAFGDLNANFPAGTLVKFLVNSNDVITSLEAALQMSGGSFDANGIYNSYALDSDAVVFSFTGDDLSSADSYEIVPAANAFGNEFDEIRYFIDQGNFTAVLLSGLASEDNIYAAFVELEGYTKDGPVWTALYDGVVKSLVLQGGLNPVAYTPESTVFYKLKLSGDEVVTKITQVVLDGIQADTSGRTTVTGNIFRDGSQRSYSLNSDLDAYLYEDGGWSAVTKSALNGRANQYQSITLYDVDNDDVYDIAVVYKDYDTTITNYAILLATSIGEDDNAEKGFASLLLEDGTCVEYEASNTVTGGIVNGSWANAFESGSLIRFTLDSQNVMVSMSSDCVTAVDEPKQFGEDGSYGGVYMGQSPVIFSYNGNGDEVASNYEIIPRYDLENAGFASMDYFAENGVFKAIKVTGISYAEATPHYAVILANGSETDHYGNVTRYARLLKEDGTVGDLQVKMEEWVYQYPEGSLIRYLTNDENRIVSAEQAVVSSSTGKFDENGVFNSMAVTEDTVIFVFEGDDFRDAENYYILSADELRNAAFTSLNYISQNGDYLAMILTGYSVEDHQYAVFTKKCGRVADGEVWSALYRGSVQELTLDAGTAPVVYTPESPVLYALSTSRNGVVTRLTEASIASISADISAATSISGSVFRDGSNHMYSLDTSVAIYVYSEMDDEWVSGSTDKLAGNAGSFNNIQLFDTDQDGDYDIAIANVTYSLVRTDSGYAVVLTTDNQTIMKLLLADGSSKTYTLDPSLSVDVSSGELVWFALNGSGMIVEISGNSQAAEQSPLAFDGAGSCNGLRSDGQTIIYSYNGEDPAAAENYSVLHGRKLANMECSAMSYLAADGLLQAVVVTGLTQGLEPEFSFMADQYVQEEIADDQSLNGCKFVLDDSGSIDQSSFILLGAESLASLKENDVITVYLYNSGGYSGNIAKLEVSNTTVEGTVTRINADGDQFMINGEMYSLADDAECRYLEVEDSGIFYLNYAGQIFAFEAEDDSTTDYAIVLATGITTGRYGEEEAFIRLLKADGTVADFEVKSSVYQAYGGSGWTSYIPAGTLTKYTCNADNVVVALELADSMAAQGSFDVNGLFQAMMLTDKTVVFVYEGDMQNNADSYQVINPDALRSASFDDICYIVSAGEFKAVIVSGLSVDDNKVAIFIKQSAVTADGPVWMALYDREVKELTTDASLTLTVYTEGSELPFYKLTFNRSGVVTRAVQQVVTAILANVDGATSVTGSVFKDGQKSSYSLDSSVVVYAYSEMDEEWVVKGASFLAGRAGFFNRIALADTDSDGDYDIVLAARSSHIHNLEKVEAVEPTSTEPGNSEYWTCTICGKFFADEAGIEEIEKDSWLLPATGVVFDIGDADGDGTVGAEDRVLLSRYLAGWQGIADRILDLDAMDINKDGKVNAKDRVILSRYLANWGPEYDAYFTQPSNGQ